MFAATPSHTASFACNFSTQDVCWVQKPVVSRPTGTQRNRGPRSKQNVFQCAVWLFPPALTYTLWPVFEKGEARCLGVLAGVNHCCRCRLESQQSFVASGAFVFGCHPENRPPTLGGGSRSCFPPRSSLLWFALNCVSAHRSVFVPSSRPSSLHIVLSSLELLSPYKIECWSLREFGGSSQRNNYLNIFPRFILKSMFCSLNCTRKNHPLMDADSERCKRQLVSAGSCCWSVNFDMCQAWKISQKKISITENFLSQTVGSKCSEMWPKTWNPSMHLGCSDI